MSQIPQRQKLPTLDQIVVLAEQLTGRRSTLEEIAEARQLLDMVSKADPETPTSGTQRRPQKAAARSAKGSGPTN